MNSLLKPTIYRPTNETGVRSIWDWSDKANNYIQRKHGNRFQAYIEKNGKTKSASFGSIIDAVKWRTKLKVELDKCESFEIVNFNQLFIQFTDHKRKQVEETSLGAYFTLYKRLDYFDKMLVEDITFKTIDNWLKLVTSDKYLVENKVKNSRFSYLKEIKLLGQIFNYYRDYNNGQFVNPILARHRRDSVYKKDVLEKRKSEKESKYMTYEEIDLFLKTFKAQADDKPSKRLYYLCALIQLRTGMRIGEVCALCWQDIDWKTGILVVNKTVQWRRNTSGSKISEVPKNRKNRTILLLPEVLSELKTLLLRLSGVIFSDDGVNVKSYGSILHHYNQAFKKANLKFSATHIARHSFATDFANRLQNRTDVLQGILGHSSIKQTAVYAKRIPKANVEVLRIYGEELKQDQA